MRQFHYQQQVVPHVEAPYQARPIDTSGDGQRVAQAAFNLGSGIVDALGKDWRRRESARVDAAIADNEHKFEVWRNQYMQENQGVDAQTAQQDFINKYAELADQTVADFGGNSNEVFQGDLRRKLFARGIAVARDGGNYERGQIENWQRSQWDGQVADFARLIADNPDDADQIAYRKGEMLQSWREQNPGLDDTDIQIKLAQMADEGRVNSFIAAKDWDKAEQVLGTGDLAAPQTLGDAVKRFESGADGVHTVANTKGDPGGISYGTYQLSTNKGSMGEWISHLARTGGEEGAAAARELAAAAKAGTLPAVYKELAVKHEGLFQRTQHDYIKKTHYDPALAKSPKAFRELVAANPALQEMVWSTAVQHGGGGAAQIFNKVWRDGMSIPDLINDTYDERGRHFGSSSPRIRQNQIKRFLEERGVVTTLHNNLNRSANIDTSKRIHFNNAIEAGRRQEQAALKVGVNQRLDDWFAQCKDGLLSEPPVTAQEVIAAFGEHAEEKLNEIESWQNFAAISSGLNSMTIEQQVRLLEEMQPKAGAPDYKEKAAQFGLMEKRIGLMHKAIAEDAAGWVNANDEAVMKARQDFRTAGTPESFQNYRRAMQTAFEARGIPSDQLLSKSDAQGMADNLAATPEPHALIETWRQIFGPSFRQAMHEIMPKSAPYLQVIANGMDEKPAKLLRNAMLDKDFEKRATEVLMIKNVAKTDFETNVSETLAELNSSLMGLGNADLAKAVTDSARRLALSYIMNGYEQDDAIARACDDVGLARYTISKNPNNSRMFYRIPKSQDTGFVTYGAKAWLADADLDGLEIANYSWADNEITKKDYADLIRKQGQWRTNGDETGLALYVGFSPVIRPDGSVLNVGWDELDQLGRKAEDKVLEARGIGGGG